ncbi:hypothetical protein Pan216_50110 [Planctomycetes bacterium Pan216]|uniref:Uncharacterized protein n=1 Tax=Kolteria novifilia TaxID=2527975 RepID=A0A518BAW8_9BACT|nr:hypothetical protein Pan216_50110 [Planctomycetes bacterium Pan216]
MWKRTPTSLLLCVSLAALGCGRSQSPNMSRIVVNDPEVTRQLQEDENKRLEELQKQHEAILHRGGVDPELKQALQQLEKSAKEQGPQAESR